MRRPLVHRALRFLPAEERTRPTLKTRVAVRPARFAIALEKVNEWPDLGAAPVSRARYLGRVQEVGPGDEVLATLWECPSGRAVLAELSVAKEFEGNAPRPGDVLDVLTWVELPGGGRKVLHHRITRHPRKLSEEERGELRQLITALEQELHET